MPEPVHNEVVTSSDGCARRSPLPDLGDVIFLCLIYLMVGLLPDFVLNDGSTGWHLVTGHYILQSFSIPQHDLISYTFPDKPWVAYEWFFDLIAALLDKAGGLKLVAVASCSAIAFLFLLIYEDCRKSGCHFLLAMILTVVGALTSSVHWLARPVLFTFYGVYVFSRSLESFRLGQISDRRLKVILSLTTLVWANSHPAFLMGFVIAGIYLVSESFTAICLAAGEKKDGFVRRAQALATTLLLVVLVSFLNPYGAGLYTYVSQYLNQSAVLAANTEFMSPSFHGEFQSTCLEILLLSLAIGLAACRRRPALAPLLVTLAFTHLALSALRNEPVFVIVAVPFIARLFAGSSCLDVIAASSEGATFGRLAGFFRQRWLSAGQSFDQVESLCSMHIVPLLVVALLVLSCFYDGKLFGHSFVASGFDPRSKPTATLDFVRRKKLAAERGFNFDNWGGYIRYVSGERVFIDDRSDFYGEPFYLEYGQVSLLEPGWQKILEKHRIQWVLFPSNSKLACRLKEEPGWKLVAEDRAASLFVRSQLPKGAD